MSGLEGRMIAHARRFRGAAPCEPQRQLEACARLGIRVLALGAAEYPDFLAAIPDPPDILYCSGALPRPGAVAVVGSRRPTPYGRRMARLLGRECAEAGAPLVSGLARGVDAEAHSACVESGGATWGVLGSGLDRVYPPEHAALAREILAGGGGLLSEVPLGGAPVAENFPRRNRIISGLCLATVVVEGDMRSGALITARLAAEQGREVLAVPGPADSPLSEGPNDLLSRGAGVARRLADVLGGEPRAAAAWSVDAGGGAARHTLEQQKILELLGGSELAVEELLLETGWEPARLFRCLSTLETRDLVRRVPGQRYGRS